MNPWWQIKEWICARCKCAYKANRYARLASELCPQCQEETK